MALYMKLRFTQEMFVNWWPEDIDRQAFGKLAYKDAAQMFKSILMIDDLSEEPIQRKGESLTFIRVT
jgi:hypothetical protein